VAYGVKATGENLSYRWQRWTGASWMDLYNSSTDIPGVLGAQTDSLTLTAVPRSWDNTRLKCIVENPCGTVDTTFTLYVKECFDILDIEWDMCEGIRPETNPARPVDGWYCPGTKISICARLIMDEPGVELGEAIYKWTVDGLSTTDGKWGEMTFISSSSVLSWVPPADWQDNITVALCAYIDGACDTVCKSYLRLKASPFQKVDLTLHNSVEPANGFCGGDTIRIWADEQGTAGLNPTFRWYNDIFDMHTEVSPTNELLTKLDDKMKVSDILMRMDQQDTWVKVIMTPSPEVCTEQPFYEEKVFLKLKPSVNPKLEIWTEDTLACINDEIYMEARWENAGANPTFQWTRSIGFPYWNLGTDYNTTTVLDDKDVWIKCELFPSKEVCYAGDPLVDVVRITALTNPEVLIYADLDRKVAGDEIRVDSDLSGMPVKNPDYTWFINNLMMVGEERAELISNMFRQGDKIQLGVRGGQICQNMVMSNILTIDYDNSKRDTLVNIHKGEQVRNLDMFKPGDMANEFFIAPNGYTGSGRVYMSLDGKFNYIPDADFTGMDKVTYIVVNKYTGAVETGYIYIQVSGTGKHQLPNIITPNGDGMNDKWVLNFLEEYPDHMVTIYNRNGKVVFRARNYQHDWDGTGQGNSGYVTYSNLPNGIYTYVIDLGNREVLKGWLEIRKDMSRGRYSRY
jgi:gliding motility-associated-like protein